MAWTSGASSRNDTKARHRRCRAFCFLLAGLAAACTPAEPPETPPTGAPVIVGRLEDRDIDEASGIAASRREQDVFWIVNDSGKPRLHAVDSQGRELGKVKVVDANNSDWEDLAAFDLDGEPYLLVADIGDNDAKRRDVRVYAMAEPEPDDRDTDVAWKFDFSYPDGPRDAEALAVDAGGDRILVLSKRDIPPLLYELPLKPGDDDGLVATRLGPITTLPRPRRQDFEFAPATKYWWWQPTAMDIAADGSAAVILTYRGVYLYRRIDAEDWFAAFGRRPAVLYEDDLDKAESVAFGPGARSVYITFEGRGAPLVRIDLDGAASE